MKNFIATTLIAVASFVAPVHAEQATCAEIGALAYTIMEVRQSGRPMSVLMEIASETPSLQRLVIAAYDTPRYSTKKYQLEAASDFRNDVEAICYGSGS